MSDAVVALKEQLKSLDMKRTAVAIAIEALTDKPKVRRGRKLGSKNKPKTAAPIIRDAEEAQVPVKKKAKVAKIAVASTNGAEE